MKIFFMLLIIATIIALNTTKFLNQLGHCEPLTVEFIATLVTRKARLLLSPRAQHRSKQLRFDLYTRLNPEQRQVLRTDDQAALLKSNFNANWPIRFTIHGWHGQTTTCSNAAIKDAYLAKGDYNVILVDWSDYSLDINYISVIVEVFEIAQKFNHFTRLLHRVYDVRFEDMYLIGHSFGCHIAGVAGKLLQKPNRYGVIYALDTAGPIHRRLKSNWRLTASDAIYVESIQTDVALLGFASESLGHASFYPNWGLGQPHCPNGTQLVPEFACDHFSALYYFVESLQRSKAFGAIRCRNYQSIDQVECDCGEAGPVCEAQVYMGGDPAVEKHGVYYLSTRSKRPFGYGEVCRIKRPREPTIKQLK